MTASTALTQRDETQAGEIMESVIVKGDLGKLSPEERSRYYLEVCKSVGLNPLTQPFAYITLNNKLTLYALRGCTDQLRAIHKVSVEDLTETERGDVFIVTAKVKNGEGRTDMAKGAVTIGSLKGDALANMIMKAETKAKRRATLSICGLGVLDETEIETIPANGKQSVSAAQAKRDGHWDAFRVELAECETALKVEKLRRAYIDDRDGPYWTWPQVWKRMFGDECDKRLAEFSQGDELQQTLEDSVAAEPQTRAEYIQFCHERIATEGDATALLTWYNGEKDARRRFSFSKVENDALKDRVLERKAELDAGLEHNPAPEYSE